MKRTRHKVEQELETAKKIVAAGGTANVDALQNELEGIGAQKEPLRNPAAAACGAIGGIGTHCQNALGQLGAITERLYIARDSRTLTVIQCDSVEDMLELISAITIEINDIWKRAHALKESGIAVKPVSLTTPMEVSLF